MSTSKKDTLSKEQRIKTVIKKIKGKTPKNTPPIFKLPSKKNTTIAFSLSDVRELIKQKGDKSDTVSPLPKTPLTTAPKQQEEMPEVAPRVLKAATLDDLLGVSVAKPQKRQSIYTERDESEVPNKFLPYFRKLIAMRNDLLISVGERSEQILGASAKDAAGDLSSYSQHIADAGTDAANYDFALNLVSNQQELLREIELALNRIFDGTYGICEVTGKPISRERLRAVPFTRFSKEGQDEYEKTVRKSVQRIGIATSEDGEDITLSDDENEEV